MTFGLAVGQPATSMAPSPSPSPGNRTTLVTVDIVVLVVYFLLILAVGFWVGTGEKKQVIGPVLTRNIYTAYFLSDELKTLTNYSKLSQIESL